MHVSLLLLPSVKATRCRRLRFLAQMVIQLNLRNFKEPTPATMYANDKDHSSCSDNTERWIPSYLVSEKSSRHYLPSVLDMTLVQYVSYSLCRFKTGPQKWHSGDMELAWNVADRMKYFRAHVGIALCKTSIGPQGPKNRRSFGASSRPWTLSHKLQRGNHVVIHRHQEGSRICTNVGYYGATPLKEAFADKQTWAQNRKWPYPWGATSCSKTGKLGQVPFWSWSEVGQGTRSLRTGNTWRKSIIIMRV